ncbi:RNase3 domain-containing protein [Phlyctema vagabunda]|uniref:RNase3 domain-containing protein n=1 Tax=Phlyctema vagabunda TaxID=108571 RepID=A0ABR4PDS5_9HELO
MHKRKFDDRGSLRSESISKIRKSHEHQSQASSSNTTPLGYNNNVNGTPVNQKPPGLQKVARLLHALDEALDGPTIDDLLSVVGEGTVNTCVDLRRTLRKEAQISDEKQALTLLTAPPLQQASLSNSQSSNVPKSISPLSITPWRAAEIPKTLPPLPKVLDPTLEESAFIHGGLAHKAHSLSYERLEWVGDAYIELTSTLIIAQTFPHLTPGESSSIRQLLVKNITLANYAHQYKMPQRVRMPPDVQALSEKDKTKMWGDVFEAYVAAVILSDPENGVARCADWLKQLWSMTIAKDIRLAEAKGPRLVTPMWNLMGGTKPVDQKALPKAGLNPKEQLTQKIGSRGVKITYKDAAPEKRDQKVNLPLFTVGVYLDGWGENNKQLGFGRAHGKKDAGFKAAEMALNNEKLMKVYVEKKKLFDAQLALEEEAARGQEELQAELQ